MTIEIKDHLIALGIFGQRATNLSDIPGITKELIDDAFRRAKSDDSPIAIADNIEQRAEARGRNLDRLKRGRQAANKLNVQRREDRERDNLNSEQQVRDEIEIISQIPEGELESLIKAVTEEHPWITIKSVTENRMLRCLVIERMERKKGRAERCTSRGNADDDSRRCSTSRTPNNAAKGWSNS